MYFRMRFFTFRSVFLSLKEEGDQLIVDAYTGRSEPSVCNDGKVTADYWQELEFTLGRAATQKLAVPC